MDGLFVFDQQNDIVFTRLNGKINHCLHGLAKKQELLPNDTVRFIYNKKHCSKDPKDFFLNHEQFERDEIDTNVIVQLFSPLIASQRIMFCQFDNSYTSIQLKDNINLVFEEVNFKKHMHSFIIIALILVMIASSWDFCLCVLARETWNINRDTSAFVYHS